MQRLPVFAALLAVAAACTEPTLPPLSLLIQSDTVAATGSTAGEITWVRFTVPVTAHNFGIARLVLHECDLWLDRRVGGGWETVWFPACELASGLPVEIPPGQTRAFTVDVSAAISGPGRPSWTSDEVEGAYRLGTWAGRYGATRVASNTFAVTWPH